MVVIGEKPKGVQRAKWVLEWPGEAYPDFPGACAALMALFRPMPASVPSPRVKTLRVCQDENGVLTAIVLCDKPKYYSWVYLDAVFGVRPSFVECTLGQAKGYKMFMGNALMLMNDQLFGESYLTRRRKMARPVGSMPPVLPLCDPDMPSSSEEEDDRMF